VHGKHAPAFVAERIGAVALAGGEEGITPGKKRSLNVLISSDWVWKQGETSMASMKMGAGSEPDAHWNKKRDRSAQREHRVGCGAKMRPVRLRKPAWR